MQSQAIIVLGMHRSGTSMITRGLLALGVELGDSLIQSAYDNPKGFWEDRNIVGINEALLAISGQTWDSAGLDENVDFYGEEYEQLRNEARSYIQEVFISKELWGFKDPRTALLLGFWLPLLEEMGVSISFVVSVRNPAAVVQSLERRNGFSYEKSYAMWLGHMNAAINGIGSYSAVVVDYKRMLIEPIRQLERIAERLSIARHHNDESIRAFAEDFVDPLLSHASEAIADDLTIANISNECYQLLKRAANDDVALDGKGFHALWLTAIEGGA
jgi:hypothetical protein